MRRGREEKGKKRDIGDPPTVARARNPGFYSGVNFYGEPEPDDQPGPRSLESL